jgi:hypothetical protein
MVASFASSMSESFFIANKRLDSPVLPRCIQRFLNLFRTHLTVSLGMLDTLRQPGNVSRTNSFKIPNAAKHPKLATKFGNINRYFARTCPIQHWCSHTADGYCPTGSASKPPIAGLYLMKRGQQWSKTTI